MVDNNPSLQYGDPLISGATGNGNMEDPGNGNPPTGWSAGSGSYAATLTATADSHAGSYGLNIAKNGQNSFMAYQQFAGASIGFYYLEAYAKRVSASTNYQLSMSTNATGSNFAGGALFSDASYTKRTCTGLFSSGTLTADLRGYRSSGTTENVNFDDVVLKPIVLSSMFWEVAASTRVGTYSANVTVAGSDCAGMIIKSDSDSNPQNFVIASVVNTPSGYKARLYTFLNGAWSATKINASITYAAGAPLSVTVSYANGTYSYAVNYNGSAVSGSPVSITDLTINKNVFCGKFATDTAPTVASLNYPAANTDIVAYYIANAGDDTAAGDVAHPWKSLNNVTNFGFRPGDTCYFNKGDSWTGDWMIQTSGVNGSPISFDAYGSGANPKFYLAVNVPAAKWTLVAGKSYTYQATQDVNSNAFTSANFPNMASDWSSGYGMVWYGTAGEYATNYSATSINDVEAHAGSCWYDSTNKIVYYHAIDGNPPTNDTWVSITNYGINSGAVNAAAADYINWSNLDLYYPSCYGFANNNRNCSTAGSYNNYNNCNVYYGAGDAFSLGGVGNTMTGCKTYYCKYIGFQLKQLGGVTPIASNNSYVNCEYATNTVGTTPYGALLYLNQAFACQYSVPNRPGIWQITNCTVSGDCIEALTTNNTDGVTVDGLTVTGAVSRYITHDIGSTAVSLKNVTNTQASGYTYGTCLFNGTAGISFSENVILSANNKHGVYLQGTTGNATISGNKLTGSGTGTGIYVDDATTSKNNLTNNIITGFANKYRLGTAPYSVGMAD